MRKRIANWSVLTALGLGIAAALAVLAAGFGYRWELWDLHTGFAILPWGAYAGAAAAALAVIAGIWAAIAGARWAVVGSFPALLIGLAALGLPLDMQMRGARVPPIHDITTDTDDPPQFNVLRDLRRQTINGFAYEGAEIARQQRQAYPDIGPMRARFAPPDVLARAQAIARDLGWEIVASGSDGFEASVRTPWWGFTDDMVVRVRADGDGSLVDVRSASRIGKSDLGVNAARVRAFITRFRN